MNAGYEYGEIIGPEAAGRTLVDHLAARWRHSSRDAWEARIVEGRVRVDGRAATADVILRAGQSVVWRRPPWSEPEAPLAWALLHRDDDLLAVAKPAGLPTIPGGGFLENTLLSLVRRRFPEAAPVHRLDRGASGIVLLARSARARDRLAHAFREGRVAKEYRALVCGAPVRNDFAIETPIGRVPHPLLGRVFAALGPEGTTGGPAASRHAARSARTEVEVVERREDTTLLLVRPLTGRPHQIRIHLAAAGLPLVGEPLYLAGGAPRSAGAWAGSGGYRLHGRRLSFPHPASRQVISIDCLPPPVLRRASGEH